ncbi:MAG: PQQ-binding-like beta-propeller repeat protein [Candidatus Hydrogenedentota bacterium]
MTKRELVLFPSVLVMALTSSFSQADSAEDYWPSWRGPNSDGVAVKGDPPITWSETENVKWKVALPDSSDCTPVIWGDRIFIQVAVPMEEGAEADRPTPPEIEREILMPKPKMPYKFNIMCLDRGTGETLWEETVRTEYPHEGFHPSGGLANYSPVTDGEHVWFSFGSRGVHCFTVDGQHVWSSDLMVMYTLRGFGEGSSPAVVDNAVIVVADHEGESKIFAFDKSNGDLLWEKERDEESGWATPTPVEVNGETQIIVSGTNMIRSYDVETGDLVWECSGLTKGSIPSPVVSDGKVFLATGYQKPKMMAIALGGKGDISTSDAITWTADEGMPYIATPLLYNDRIYTFDNLKANLSCYEASTGRAVFVKEKLTGMKQIYASPVGAAGRIYTVDRKGTFLVLKQSDSVEILATNKLDDDFDASPVIVGDELYLKGAKFLYCIAKG